MTIEIIPHLQNKQIEFKLQKVAWSMRKGIRTALFEIGAENTQQVKRFIYAPPKTGRYYRYKKRWHRASAPGESPANRSGFLARTIDYRVKGIDRVEIISEAIYANVLEDGYVFSDGREIKPRPYLIRTANKKRRDNYNSLKRHVYDRIKT